MSSLPPPSPGTIVVPLPPGMTPEQFQSLQGSLVAVAITVAVSFAILVWDYFHLLPDEIKLYQTSDESLWRTPAPWAFVVLRYSGILATFPALFFTSIQSKHCQLAVSLSQGGVCAVVASSGIIFGCRLAAIWNGNRIISAFVALIYFAMVGCWVTLATQFHATEGPRTHFGSNCRMIPVVSWSSISFASSVAFDAVILLLTLFKLKANTSGVGPCHQLHGPRFRPHQTSRGAIFHSDNDYNGLSCVFELEIVQSPSRSRTARSSCHDVHETPTISDKMPPVHVPTDTSQPHVQVDMYPLGPSPETRPFRSPFGRFMSLGKNRSDNAQLSIPGSRATLYQAVTITRETVVSR